MGNKHFFLRERSVEGVHYLLHIDEELTVTRSDMLESSKKGEIQYLMDLYIILCMRDNVPGYREWEESEDE